MKIEVLFPEHCNLFADSANVRYLEKCLPDAEFIYTSLKEEPAFLKEEPNLIYMGAMTEKTQLMVINKLLPYKARIEELIEKNVPFLMTCNALEVFCKTIEHEDGSSDRGLGLFDVTIKQDMLHRYNGLLRGSFKDMTIVGFRSQFTTAYKDVFDEPFIRVERGRGMYEGSDTEGLRRNNFFGTYLVGPFLVINPHFTKYLLSLMGVKSPKLAFEEVIIEAYERRLVEFNDKKVKFED